MQAQLSLSRPTTSHGGGPDVGQLADTKIWRTSSEGKHKKRQALQQQVDMQEQQLAPEPVAVAELRNPVSGPETDTAMEDAGQEV